MAHIYFCNNPRERCTIGDCVIRALSKALNKSWDDVYIDLASEGFFIKDMPSSNEVWGSYLSSKGFNKHSIPGRYSSEGYSRNSEEEIRRLMEIAGDPHEREILKRALDDMRNK